MLGRKRKAGIILGCGLLIAASLVLAEEEGAGVKRHGVIHNIADDRKVERVGGIYEPESLDKYMRRKFDEVFSKLDRMEGQLTDLQTAVERIEKAVLEQKKEKGTLTS